MSDPAADIRVGAVKTRQRSDRLRRTSYGEVSRLPAWGLFDGNKLVATVRAPDKTQAIGIFMDNSEIFTAEMAERVNRQFQRRPISRSTDIRVEKL